MASKIVRKKPKSPASTEAGRTNVLLEHMQTQFNVVLDAVLDLRKEIPRQIDALRQELGGRIDVLEVAVKMNSSDIRELKVAVEQNSKDIQKNSEDIRQNSRDIQKNSEDIQKNSEDIRKNSEDIQLLQKQVGHIYGVLETEMPGKVIRQVK